MFRVPELRNKILFTLFILMLYRLGSFLPAPGIDTAAVDALRDSTSENGGILAFVQLFSGGGLTSFALFALGVFPYITASIIMQVLGVVVPRIEEWQQQGAVGQRKITQWTRYMTVAIAIIQSTSFAFLFNNGSALGGGFVLMPKFNVFTVLLVVLTLTAGTALLMWMGELITQRGIGNGMSLIITASIVSQFPAQFTTLQQNQGWAAVVAFFIILAVALVGIVFVEQGQRRIPVQFAKRVVGRKMYGGQSTYIPLKVNQSGVIPIIFASSVLYLPNLIAVALPATGWGESTRSFVNNNLADPSAALYLIVFGVLIVGFAYFYTAITFDPAKQADTIRKQGGFIPGIRPGPQTERYLSRILTRITLPGALFIAAVALLPNLIMSALGFGLSDSHNGGLSAAGFGFIGISILIAVGVSLETMKQIDTQLMQRNYEGFLAKK